MTDIKPQLMGFHAINPFATHNSASRGYMLGTHVTQHLVLKEMEERIIYAGPEVEFAKYTLGVRMPADGIVRRVIQKYPSGVDKNALGFNPSTLVIFENLETQMMDCFEIPYHVSYHQTFGWPCKPTEFLGLLTRPQVFIPKNTCFTDTPGVLEGQTYACGRNVNVLYATVDSVAEDGVVISESEQKRWTYYTYETRTVRWGSKEFPIHTYGPFQFFPEIGDYTREDGLLMAFRPHEPLNYAETTSLNALQTVDHYFDRKVYVPPGRGRVVDIEVYTSRNGRSSLFDAPDSQAQKYAAALLRYHQEIVNVERWIRTEWSKQNGITGPCVSPELQQRIVRSMAIVDVRLEGANTPPIRYLHRKRSIDEYFLNITVEYARHPNVGDKFSNYSGCKGVVCEIRPDAQMPRRSDGLQAHMILDPRSNVNRMNVGQLYEQAISQASVDTTIAFAHALGLIEAPRYDLLHALVEIDIDHPALNNSAAVDAVWKTLCEFYGCFNPQQAAFFSNVSHQNRVEHLCAILNERVIRIFFPTDNAIDSETAALRMAERGFYPRSEPLLFTLPNGETQTTSTPALIGPVYTLLLDKVADEWAASATSPVHHFGIVSSVTQADRYAKPYRNSPSRVVGETESRLMLSYTPLECLLEILDRTNAPETRLAISRALLRAPVPSNIEQIVDRTKLPLGRTRQLELLRHIFLCAGVEIDNVPNSR